ncbi:MAG: hypothetical protein HY898_12305 [Deltaproteobacteria bacterium]|nr:hypothetical protein [Deltaproteobacteria bacterium]
MRLSEIQKLLNCELISDALSSDPDIEQCFAADLMSDVLAYSTSEAILITGLSSIQSVHTADVADLRAIIFVHDKRPGPQVVELARNKKIPLLTTKLNLFDACGVLHGKGLKGA